MIWSPPRRATWPPVLWLVSGLLAAGLACSEREPRTPPNIVLVMLDTARADRMPCYGYGRETTPNACSLADEGLLFVDALAPAPWTLPSHASLFTGRPPGQHGLHWGHPRVGTRRPMAVQEPERLLAQRLSEAGYTTVGISNNPWVSHLSGLSGGFDHFVEVWEEREEVERLYAGWPEEWKTRPNVDGLSSGKALVLAKKVFAEEQIEHPYFLFLSFVEPHMPYAPARELVGRFGGDPAIADRMRQADGSTELDLLSGAEEGDPRALGNLYDEELLTADRTLGYVFDWLEERGDFEDALIVVTSDHGEHLGEGGRYSHQLSMEPELLRIPLVLRLPMGVAGGRAVTRGVSLMDLYPTLLEAAGTPVGSPGRYIPYRLAVDVLSGPTPSAGPGVDAPGRIVISELYYSDKYLAQLARRNPDFDREAHSVVRRSWFLDGEEHRFQDARRLGPESGQASEVIRLDELYMRGLREVRPGPGASGLGSERVLEELKALGYLESGDEGDFDETESETKNAPPAGPAGRSSGGEAVDSFNGG